jgi:quinol---cytochrome c reductase iron-sulfur subunit, bacillus type
VEPQEGRPDVPGPSLWPVGFAVGIACVLVGLVVSWPAVAVGALIALVFGFLWIRDVTRDVQGEPKALADSEPAPAAPTVAEVEEPPAKYPRNKFLELSTLGLGAVITGIVTVPVLGFLVWPAFVDQKLDDIDLGPLENFPEGQFVETTYLSNPREGEISRRTVFIRSNGDLQPGVPSFTLISNRCVHLGCPVSPSGPRSDQQETVRTETGELTLTEVSPAAYNCPCHGGAYDTEGNRTAGPPVRALDRFFFSIKEDRLFLGEAYAVAYVKGEGADAMIKRYPHTTPGVHVDGVERWLYPIQPSQVSS